MKLIINILNLEKTGKIRELTNIKKGLGVDVIEEKQKIIFNITNQKIKSSDLKTYLPMIRLMLKGRGCRENKDYSLEVEE